MTINRAMCTGRVQQRRLTWAYYRKASMRSSRMELFRSKKTNQDSNETPIRGNYQTLALYPHRTHNNPPIFGASPSHGDGRSKTRHVGKGGRPSLPSYPKGPPAPSGLYPGATAIPAVVVV